MRLHVVRTASAWHQHSTDMRSMLTTHPPSTSGACSEPDTEQGYMCVSGPPSACCWHLPRATTSMPFSKKYFSLSAISRPANCASPHG